MTTDWPGLFLPNLIVGENLQLSYNFPTTSLSVGNAPLGRIWRVSRLFYTVSPYNSAQLSRRTRSSWWSVMWVVCSVSISWDQGQVASEWG